uniref:Uncharacterized protein n=1 Tax=Podoviridae sp. cthau23 TaxID=2825268 RepID=A0A8S5U778_9CAUD|nr:MAG TPA: hypothetical protein [Podoviridae sp. cthau23]
MLKFSHINPPTYWVIFSDIVKIFTQTLTSWHTHTRYIICEQVEKSFSKKFEKKGVDSHETLCYHIDNPKRTAKQPTKGAVL